MSAHAVSRKCGNPSHYHAIVTNDSKSLHAGRDPRRQPPLRECHSGYGAGMTETPKGLAEEATTGRSPRTPALVHMTAAIVFGGLAIAILAIVLVVFYVVQ